MEKIIKTADQWQLYTDYPSKEEETGENASMVANRLNQYMFDAVSMGGKVGEIFVRFDRILYSDKVAGEFGAWDTEPRWAAQDLLCEYLGIDPDALNL
jgi:hypothetical protein